MTRWRVSRRLCQSEQGGGTTLISRCLLLPSTLDSFLPADNKAKRPNGRLLSCFYALKRAVNMAKWRASNTGQMRCRLGKCICVTCFVVSWPLVKNIVSVESRQRGSSGSLDQKAKVFLAD
ncbi:unnamed protein product [Protopolystoma xenopodis]|uniref:Uncharacterized protein n=1 Tax=Protopolystoma xenopodis TaxID=117903 RepID=A0A3S5BY93_9PLAT|nr:unnamed protein product [Protopolystoma xenopodis]